MYSSSLNYGNVYIIYGVKWPFIGSKYTNLARTKNAKNVGNGGFLITEISALGGTAVLIL